MDESQDGEWLRPFEAAKLIGVGRTTAYRWLDRWARDGVRILRLGPHTTLIDKASLLDWQSRQELHPEPAQPPKPRGRKPAGWRERIRKLRTDDDVPT